MVEDVGFVNFVKFITEELGRIKVHITKRAQVCSDIVDLAQCLRLKVKESIGRSCLYFSMTRIARNAASYISFTIYYVTENFDLASWTLEVMEISGKHDAYERSAVVDLYETRALTWLHLVISSGLIMQYFPRNTSCSFKEKTSERDIEPWERIVSAEPDSLRSEIEGEEELSVEDLAQMENLRDGVLDEVESLINSSVEHSEKVQLANMRTIVQSFDRWLSTSENHQRLEIEWQ
ncbi:Hypothetical protein PHPALM_6474 [Phytophthora palmivora]|uniref:Uncharacterized protein n=1 Tax=Phytophthora palmivora TaxID=4796 RepID=A0A2P4YEQ3_9STRA|nr:Hypothetical protein PHPALM_6474 [Phytophthora palmivora]